MAVPLAAILKKLPHARLGPAARLPDRICALKRWPLWAWGIFFLAAAGLLALSFLSPTAASPASSTPAGQTISTTVLGFSVLLKLGAVVMLIYLCLYLLKRWQSRIIQATKNRMAVLETTHLSPRQAIHIVQVGSQVFLIGATDQSLTLLSEIEASEVETAKAAGEPGAFTSPSGSIPTTETTAETAGFASLLRGAFAWRGTSDPGTHTL